MENKTLQEVYKNSSEEVRKLLQTKFTAEELGIKVDQQEFDTFFKGLLEGCKSSFFFNKNGKKTAIPTNHFTLCDCDGRWLFDVRTGENGHFWYSCYRILPLFKEKFGVKGLELSELMQPVLNSVLNLYDVTAVCCKYET